MQQTTQSGAQQGQGTESSRPVLACNLGGTRLRVAVVEPDGAIHAKQVVPTPANKPTTLLQTMRQVLDRAGRRVAGAVVGVPGPVDYIRGEVLELPNLRGWEGYISASELSRALGLPALLANDADLAGLGEHRYGAGQGTQDMVYVTCSTGVGASAILGGRLARGRISIAEIGHTIIDYTTMETVEQLGSASALARLAGQEATAVTARARAGEAEALRLVAQVARAFAIGVFNLVHCFFPERVVIGGGMSAAGDLLLDPVRTLLRGCRQACPGSRAVVVLAQDSDDAGLRGAAAYWADQQHA